jgi:hypothetical protein
VKKGRQMVFANLPAACPGPRMSKAGLAGLGSIVDGVSPTAMRRGAPTCLIGRNQRLACWPCSSTRGFLFGQEERPEMPHWMPHRDGTNGRVA